jgi:hypothetical protein
MSDVARSPQLLLNDYFFHIAKGGGEVDYWYYLRSSPTACREGVCSDKRQPEAQSDS